MQKNSEVLSGLVVGHKSDGRCRYDPQVKQELIRQCMKPGVSVSRMAMQHAVNANLLRTWITKAQSANAIAIQMAAPEVSVQAGPAFVPIRLETTAPNPPTIVPAQATPGANRPTMMCMRVQLPNAVAIDFGETRIDEFSKVLQVLSALPCSS
jgi:transposase-like protein